MSRLSILEKSLIKKESEFDSKLAFHFDSVKSANGQPLNDKVNGSSTIKRWENQNNSLRSLNTGIEKTKSAIEKEKCTIAWVEKSSEYLPEIIIDKIASGELIQWRKHPNMFFVPGVERARIVWDIKKKYLSYKYVSEIPTPEQHSIFAITYNALSKLLQ